jgi:hypothetical protein
MVFLLLLVLKGTTTKFGGTRVFRDVTGKDIRDGGTDIFAVAVKFAGHVACVYGVYPGGQ